MNTMTSSVEMNAFEECGQRVMAWVSTLTTPIDTEAEMIRIPDDIIDDLITSCEYMQIQQADPEISQMVDETYIAMGLDPIVLRAAAKEKMETELFRLRQERARRQG